jgi:hypothetical protein
MTITSFTRRDLLALVVILLIAAFMRFGRPGIVEYFHDDGMLATLAQEMADGRAFHLTGIISSTGIPNPPTSVYALLPFFWISRDPVFAIYGIMALNVIGVGLLWAIAHRYFGRVAAIMAGIAYAVNPWAVLYSRKLWAQDYHTPFFLLGLLLALYGFMEGEGPPAPRSRRFWAQILSLPILLFAMQIHFAAWALFPLYLILLWMGRKRVAWRTLALSAILSGLVLLPYSIGLAQTLQQDPTRISDAMGRTQEREGFLSSDAFADVYHMATAQSLSTWVAPAQMDAFKQEVDPQSLNTILFHMIAWGLIFLARFKHPLGLWMVWWAFGPMLLLTFNLTQVYPHYFIASLPAYAVLIGLVAAPLTFMQQPQEKSKTRLGWGWRILGVLLVVGFMLTFKKQFVYWNDTLDFVNTHHIPYPGFTTPLHYLTDIRDTLKDETDVVVLSDGMAWDLNHEVSVWDTLLYDKTCVRTLRGDGYAVLPNHPFAVLVASNAQAGRVMDFYSVGTPEIFPERPGGGDYKIYRWSNAPTGPYADIDSIPPAKFANGVELIGYDAGESTVTLAWHLPQGQRGENVQYTVQFFDAEGNRVGQGDKVFWQSQHWCAGDTLLTWVDVPHEATATIMHVGFYKLLRNGGYSPVAALDANGQPMGDMAEVALP